MPMDLEKLKIDRKPAKPSGRRRGSLVPTLVVLALVALALWLFRGPLGRGLDRLTLLEVEVVTATRTSPMAATAIGGTSANGYIVAAKRAALSADTPGRVVELNVVEGSTVRAGDVVARLYSEVYEAAVERAVAESAAARAAVARAAADVRATERGLDRHRAEEAAALARVASARADLRLAEKDLSRQQELVQKGVASERELDEAAANQERGRAALEAEEANLGAARAALREAEARLAVSQASQSETETRVGVSEAAELEARATLEKTFVRAPFDGIVVLKDAEVGEVVSPNSQGGNSRGSVATLVDLASLEVQIDLPETLLTQVTVGAAARVFLDAYPTEPYSGRVLRIWPTANRQKATVEIRVGFDAPDERLRPDLGARVVFLAAEQEAAPAGANEPDQVLIPQDATARIDGATGVFVIERDVATWRAVTLGEKRGGRVVVSRGLEGGERLVARPPASLNDGDRVRVAN